MTIEQAISELMGSEAYLTASRHDAALRVYLGRYRQGTLKNASAIELLEKFGYTIEVKKGKKK